jgi:hypothetical protein
LTSDHKIKANRVNARASTGPQTAQGRARALRNAFRHGLSLPVCSNPALSEEVERKVAEAQIDLRRVRYARHKLLSDALADPHYDDWREKMAVLGSLLRKKNAPDLPVEDFAASLKSMPQGPHKFATILLQEAKQLLAMDRYEQRALSRRKSAIRAFDETRRRQTDCNNQSTLLTVVLLAERSQNAQSFQCAASPPKIWDRSNDAAPTQVHDMADISRAAGN